MIFVLNLQLISNFQFSDKLPWNSEHKFAAAIDSLPHGADWRCLRHKFNDEIFDIWTRNPLDCIEELLGNPKFASSLRYRPQRVFFSPTEGDPEKCERVYDEMWDCEWWWDTQVS
jgi:hypothetical protein